MGVCENLAMVGHVVQMAGCPTSMLENLGTIPVT